MSNTLQIRRGTKTALDLITLAAGELGWTTDTKGLYIGDGANNKLYATEYIDWSATGAEDIHNDRLSGVLLADGSVPLTANWNIGNFKLGINTTPGHPLHIFNNPGASTSYGAYIDIDPSGTLSGSVTHRGLYVNINSAINRNGNGYYLSGAFIGAYSSGAADLTEIIGLDLATQHNVSTSLNISYGLRFQGQFLNGNVGSAYGSYSSVTYGAGSSGTAYYGNYLQLTMNSTGNTLTTAYGHRTQITQSNGTLTTGYLYYGNYSGTVGTKWGIFLSGEDKNYFSGFVGIGDSTPSYPLDVAHTVADATATSAFIRLTASGTGTASRTHQGLEISLTSTHDENGNYANLKTLRLVSILNAGADYNTVHGIDNYVGHGTANTLQTMYGIYTGIHNTSSGTVTVAQGNQTTVYQGGTGSIGTAYGYYSTVRVQNATGQISVGHGYHAYLDQQSGTAGTGYLYRGDYNGTWSTKWGIYLDGETKSYFSGKVGIGETSPGQALTVKDDFGLYHASNGKAVVWGWQTDYSDMWFYNGATWYTPIGISDTKTNLGAVSFYDGWMGVANLNFGTLEGCAGTGINEFSTDGTLAGDSDDAVPTEKAVKTYIDSATGTSSGCRVYRSTAQSIPGATWTKVQFDTEDYDNQNEYDNSVNYRFTAKIAGVYQVSASVIYSGMPTNSRTLTNIYKNGANFAAGNDSSSISTSQGQTVGVPIKLEAGDYVEIYTYQSSGSAVNTYTSNNCFMVVQKITAASEHGSAHENSSYVKVSDVKAATAQGGTFTSGSWITRILNTEDNDPDGVCSLSSDQITLAAGTYECRVICPAFKVDGHQARLRNVTDSETIIVGSPEYSSSGTSHTLHSFISGRFTIAASKAIEVQHRCQTTHSTNGFGEGSNNFGESNVYTVVEFWKISEDGSGSGPGFSSRISVYLGSNQTGVVTATWTKVELDTELFDGLGEFDTTNHKFTPNTAGYYQVDVCVGHEGMGDADTVQAAIYVNGSRVAHATIDTGGSSSPGIPISKMLYLSATDYVELWGRHTLGSNGAFDAGQAETFMTIHRLS